jgi:hypothetical protein
MYLNRHLVNDAHVRSFIVMHHADGWEVIEAQDSKVVRRVSRRNWQKVEPEIQRFETTANELKQKGWIEH